MKKKFVILIALFFTACNSEYLVNEHEPPKKKVTCTMRIEYSKKNGEKFWIVQLHANEPVQLINVSVNRYYSYIAIAKDTTMIFYENFNNDTLFASELQNEYPYYLPMCAYVVFKETEIR